MAFLGGLTVIPGLLYIGDQVFNDGDLCTREGTHYFDAHSEKEISFSEASERKSKNRRSEEMGRDGNRLLEQGKYEEAYEKFKEAYSTCSSGYCNESRFMRDRDNAKNKWAGDLNKQGNELWEKDKYSEAAEKYREAYNKCTSDRKDLEKRYLSNEGNCHRMQGNYARAIELFDKALAIDSSYDHAKNNRAKTFNDWAEELNKQGNELWEKDKYSEAAQKYREAYNKCTSDRKDLEKRYLSNEGNCHRMQGNYARAIELFDKALAIDSSYDHAKNNRAKTFNDWAGDLNKQGNELWEKDKYSEAAKKYREAYNKCTSDRKDLEKRYLSNEGNCYRMQGNYARAIELFDKALAIDSNYDYAKNNRAKTFNDWAEELNKQGNELWEKDKYSEAAQKYREAYNKCTSDRKDLEKRYLSKEGNCHRMQGNYARAIELFDKALAIDSSYDHAKNNRAKTFNDWAGDLNKQGNELWEKDKYSEAAQKYREAYNKCTSDRKDLEKRYLSNEGNCHRMQGNYARAIELFDKALAIDSNYDYAKNNRAKTFNDWAEDLNKQGNELWEKDKYSEAAKKYREAYNKCTSDRKDLEKRYLSNEGNCHRMQGNYARAIELFDKALAIDSNYDHAKNNRAKTFNDWARDLNKQGNELWEKDKYSEAAEKYREAYNKCTSDRKDLEKRYLSNEEY
ncbi:uncharacterized protein [Hetaerina americana]|uniref:uncharacterized protein n=1 Tax=Hetaerina americana TaxID=62018 RepID=UPI003A7F4452